MNKIVYLDHSATTRPDKRVVDAMTPYLSENFANPLSIYPWGLDVRNAIEAARESVATLINSRPKGIYFTSSGTEAVNMAIKGHAFAVMDKGKHIVASAIEHESVLNSLKTLAKLGWEYTLVGVDENGVVNPNDIADAIRDDTVLVAVNFANQEVGTIQPIAEIAEVTSSYKVKLFVDGAQSVGHIPIDVKELGIDMLSISGHRFFGPKGIGALYTAPGARVLPLIDGGMQESGRRAGTENVAGIIGLGKAAKIAADELASRLAKVTELRDYMDGKLKGILTHTKFNGHPTKRLPGYEHICVEYVEGESLILMLTAAGIYTSSGSTCSSKALKGSHVLMAMGVEIALAQGSIQFTIGPDNTREDIDYVIEKLPPIVERLRKMSPIYPGNK